MPITLPIDATDADLLAHVLRTLVLDRLAGEAGVDDLREDIERITLAIEQVIA